MQAIRSILVVLEPEHSESLALKRAKLIAGTTGARLHLLVCDKKHEHSALLSLLKSGLTEDGYSVTTEQAWNTSLHETIIEVQQAEGCGLVIKQHYPDSPLKKALLTPADWKLLRYCPVPVLLVKTATPWNDGVILAAIDVGNTDTEHRALHHMIIDYGFDIASLAKASLHVISAIHRQCSRPATRCFSSRKPSRRVIASSARHSRPRSISTTPTCISKKARRMC